MNYQGKTLDDLVTIVDETLCPCSNELLIEFISVSLKLETTTELLPKTRKQLKKLIQKHCEEDILDNEELEEATKREKLLNIWFMCTIHQHHLVEEKMINLMMTLRFQQTRKK